MRALSCSFLLNFIGCFCSFSFPIDRVHVRRLNFEMLRMEANQTHKSPCIVVNGDFQGFFLFSFCFFFNPLRHLGLFLLFFISAPFSPKFILFLDWPRPYPDPFRIGSSCPFFDCQTITSSRSSPFPPVRLHFLFLLGNRRLGADGNVSRRQPDPSRQDWWYWWWWWWPVVVVHLLLLPHAP